MRRAGLQPDRARWPAGGKIFRTTLRRARHTGAHRPRACTSARRLGGVVFYCGRPSCLILPRTPASVSTRASIARPSRIVLYACVYQPPADSLRALRLTLLTEVAEAFSPRYERHGDHLITIDIRGLDRLLGSPATIGEELRRDAADRGLRAHIAIARTRTAAMVLALSSPGCAWSRTVRKPRRWHRFRSAFWKWLRASGFWLRHGGSLKPEAWSLSMP